MLIQLLQLLYLLVLSWILFNCFIFLLLIIILWVYFFWNIFSFCRLFTSFLCAFSCFHHLFCLFTLILWCLNLNLIFILMLFILARIFLFHFFLNWNWILITFQLILFRLNHQIRIFFHGSSDTSSLLNWCPYFRVTYLYWKPRFIFFIFALILLSFFLLYRFGSLILILFFLCAYLWCVHGFLLFWFICFPFFSLLSWHLLLYGFRFLYLIILNDFVDHFSWFLFVCLLLYLTSYLWYSFFLWFLLFFMGLLFFWIFIRLGGLFSPVFFLFWFFSFHYRFAFFLFDLNFLGLLFQWKTYLAIFSRLRLFWRFNGFLFRVLLFTVASFSFGLLLCAFFDLLICFLDFFGFRLSFRLLFLLFRELFPFDRSLDNSF